MLEIYVLYRFIGISTVRFYWDVKIGVKVEDILSSFLYTDKTAIELLEMDMF